MGLICHVHTKTFHNFMSMIYFDCMCEWVRHVRYLYTYEHGTGTNNQAPQAKLPGNITHLHNCHIPNLPRHVTHINIPDCNACPHLEHKFHTIKHAVHILSKELTNSLTNYMGLSPSLEANISSANENKKITRAHHTSVTWPRWTPPMPSQPIS